MVVLCSPPCLAEERGGDIMSDVKPFMKRAAVVAYLLEWANAGRKNVSVNAADMINQYYEDANRITWTEIASFLDSEEGYASPCVEKKDQGYRLVLENVDEGLFPVVETMLDYVEKKDDVMSLFRDRMRELR
jgi:hypothetical protein